MLTSLVEEWHDDTDTACLASYSGNYTFQILIMLIRGHIACLVGNIKGKTVVADIHKDIEIVATDGVEQCGFTLAGTKTRGFDRNQIAVFDVVLCGRVIPQLMTATFPPFDQLLIHLVAKLPGTVEYDQTQTPHRHYFS